MIRTAIAVLSLVLPGCAANRLMCSLDRQEAVVISWYEVRGLTIGVPSKIDKRDAIPACMPITVVQRGTSL